VGPSVSSRHPTKELPVVDDEVREGELMRVEEERRDREGEDTANEERVTR